MYLIEILIFHLMYVLGFKEELAGLSKVEYSPEFGVVQDADRLDAIGAIGWVSCLYHVNLTAYHLIFETIAIYTSLFNLPSLSGIARCFTFGGSKKRVLHDPAIPPRTCLSKEAYMNKEEQTTVNHFHEKLLKIKDLMKTKVNLMD